MLKKTLYILLSLPLILLAATSCQDDFPSDGFVVGEGEAAVSAQVNFHPLTTSSNSVSRAPGDAISAVNDMTVFVYNDKEDELIRIIPYSELLADCGLEIDDDGNTDMPNDAGGKPAQAEETTARAKFTLKNFPFGKYRIYCVANTHNMNEVFINDEDTRAKYADAETLKNTIVEWNETDISKNDAMFGYFTYDSNDDRTSQSFEAPLIVIGQKHMNLHAWIRRCASKVTLVFDGSGLHQGIYIYIKSVTIKDIPKYCKIGASNGVYTEKGEKDSLIAVGGTIFYDTLGVSDKDPGKDHLNWLEISKGSTKKGAVEEIDGKTVYHSQNAEALYFFENMQGDYGDNKKYDKRPDWNTVGFIPEPGQPDYKDNVKYGSYIEVEAYYNSENDKQVSQGPILYRYMLGQNDYTNYNAARNRHYQLTLGFRGYANQPDWHIVYKEPRDTIFTDPSYNISYAYNHRAVFPIRMTGDVETFSVEIVENNWAPYDPKGELNAPADIVKSPDPNLQPDFEWNRLVYANANSGANGQGGYWYGLKTPRDRTGENFKPFTKEEIAKGAPEKVTGIWAGFLTLTVPEKLEANYLHYDENGRQYWYSTEADYTKFKDDFYKESRNYREFGSDVMSFTTAEWDPEKPSVAKHTVGTGNNLCEIIKDADGSTTVNLPMWTRPKTMLGISGFTGNNPYDTYQRRAIVKITVKFKNKTNPVVVFKPVYQVPRVVNPKAVWRKWDDKEDFKVKLMSREGAASSKFTAFTSDGAWRAFVKAGDPSFIDLEGGITKDETGAIVGDTGTPVEFTIKFKGSGGSNIAKCAIVEVQYHGYTCQHAIFVRQGYDEPLTIMGNAKWSSYSLYSCKGNPAIGTTWDASKKNYITADLTKNPLSLGTLFKRGNYNGILIENNTSRSFNVAPGWGFKFKMSNSKYNPNADDAELQWGAIGGLAFSKNYSSQKAWPANDAHYNFKWGHFEINKNGTLRHYRVPTQAEFEGLLKGDFGIGVLYGDGSTSTAENVSDAYGFEDFDNDGNDNNSSASTFGSRGMRGIIVFNPSNAHQVFFPIGARGMGRRTITGFPTTKISGINVADSWDNYGTLRYGGVRTNLTGNTNAFRPIPYNMKSAPGAIYWSGDTRVILNGDGTINNAYIGWDMNYFDLNFNQYDYAVSFSYSLTTDGKDPDANGSNYKNPHDGAQAGDALPIKLVLDE